MGNLNSKMKIEQETQTDQTVNNTDHDTEKKLLVLDLNNTLVYRKYKGNDKGNDETNKNNAIQTAIFYFFINSFPKMNEALDVSTRAFVFYVFFFLVFFARGF